MDKCKICCFVLFITTFNCAYIKAEAKNADDEDYRLQSDRTQTSGDGEIKLPEVFPKIDPFIRTKSTSTVIVDIPIVQNYQYFMLPNVASTKELRDFHDVILSNLREELSSININYSANVISLRPGPRLESKQPTVYARINITQHNASIVHPLITIHLSYCGHRRILGKLQIGNTIIFPLFVCSPNEVYCQPYCYPGVYCDGRRDCQGGQDEPTSCTECLYNHVRLTATPSTLHQGDKLDLSCDFATTQCSGLKTKIRWHFPDNLGESLSIKYRGKSEISDLPPEKIVSGIYRCSLNGETSDVNVTVYRRPIVTMSRSSPDSNTLIISETEGSNIELWCNVTTGAEVEWVISNSPNSAPFKQVDQRHALLRLLGITHTEPLQYTCIVRWGAGMQKIIKKDVKLILLCNKNQFQCSGTTPSVNRCIDESKRCDMIPDCYDKSDEKNCNYCLPKKIFIYPNKKKLTVDIGGQLILKCNTTSESCRPLTWLKENRPLLQSDNVIKYKSSLYIIQALPTHSGNYQCSASNSSQHTYQEINIAVLSAPRIQLIPNVRYINITKGKSAALMCRVNSSVANDRINADLTPIWQFLDEQGNSKQFASGVTTYSMFGTGHSQIIFQDASDSMTGKYRCEVSWGYSNPPQSVKIDIQINVTNLVCQSQERLCADEKMCVAKSKWCNNVRDCNDGSDESECKKCEKGFVIVQPDELIITKWTANSSQNKVTCYYPKDCHPVTWHKLGRKDNKKVIIQATSEQVATISESKLVFNNPQLSDSGLYQCSSGNINSIVNVTVVENVNLYIKPNKSYIVLKYGEKFQLDCQSDFGLPRWRRKDNTNLLLKTINKKEFPNHSSSLIIKSAAYNIIGFYICFIESPDTKNVLATKSIYVYVTDLQCTPTELLCDRKTRCVPKSKICDKIADCEDFSDEKNCPCNGEIYIHPMELEISSQSWGSFQCHLPESRCPPVKWTVNAKGGEEANTFIRQNDTLFVLNPSLSQTGTIICSSGDKSVTAYLRVKE